MLILFNNGCLLTLSGFHPSLEFSLRSFSCVTVGDQLCINYNDQNYYMDVREVLPPHASSAACIIETDCEVDFEPPPGYKEPSVSDASSSQGASAKQAYGGAPPPTTGKEHAILIDILS